MRQPTVKENAQRANAARNKKLSPKRRKEIAVNAANARWAKRKKTHELFEKARKKSGNKLQKAMRTVLKDAVQKIS
jgi:translation initiation factor 2 alpha subunit (eIF-2alpha)